MPRRAEVQARPIEPDAVYNSPLVTQVINKVMSHGKKSVAEKIVYDALQRIGEKTGPKNVPPVGGRRENVTHQNPNKKQAGAGGMAMNRGS